MSVWLRYLNREDLEPMACEPNNHKQFLSHSFALTARNGQPEAQG
jgi:hypothetical protein